MDLLEIGASFDWISPILKIGQDIANGGGHTFAVPADCGWSGNDICKTLKKQGIKTWGKMVVSDTIMFTTRKQDAPQAQSILQQNDIPIESVAPKGSKQQAGKGKESYEPGKGWGLFG